MAGTIPPGGLAGFAQMTAASRNALARSNGSGGTRRRKKAGRPRKVGRPKKKAAARAKGTKLKKGSPAAKAWGAKMKRLRKKK